MRDIVHVGYHKTATTWLQDRFFAAARDARLVERRYITRAFLDPRALEFDADEARRLLAREGDERLIVSFEGLSGNIHTGGHHGSLTVDVGRRLHDALPEATVVIFVRNQVDMIASVYGQYLRAGGTRSVGGYLDTVSAQIYRRTRFEFGHFDYHRMASFYAGLFGRDRLRVYLFEEFRDDPPAFARRLADELGLDVDVDALDYTPAHPGFRRGTMRLARFLNAFSRRQIAEKYHLVHIPGWFPKSRSLLRRLDRLALMGRKPTAEQVLGSRWVDTIRGEFAESNARLADEFGLPLERFGYP